MARGHPEAWECAMCYFSLVRRDSSGSPCPPKEPERPALGVFSRLPETHSQKSGRFRRRAAAHPGGRLAVLRMAVPASPRSPGRELCCKSVLSWAAERALLGGLGILPPARLLRGLHNWITHLGGL